MMAFFQGSDFSKTLILLIRAFLRIGRKLDFSGSSSRTFYDVIVRYKTRERHLLSRRRGDCGNTKQRIRDEKYITIKNVELKECFLSFYYRKLSHIVLIFI